MVYDAAGTGLSVYFRAPETLVENAERVDRVADLIDADNLDRMYTRVTLIRAHRLAGNLERALQITTEWLANMNHCRADTLFGKDIFAEHIWLLLEQKSPPERLNTALTDIDRWLYASARAIRQEQNRSARDLLIERARLLIALNRAAEAETNLQLFLAESDKRKPDQVAPKYVNYADACLLLGCLQERRGEPAKALETWQKAIWRNSRAEFFGTSQFPENGMPIVLHMILSSLTGEAGDFDAQRMMLSMLSNRQGASGSNQMIKQLTQFFNLDARFVEQAWLSERGQQWSRRVAFRELSYADFTRLPIKVLMAHYLRLNAYEGELPPEDEEIAALFVDRTLEQIQQGKLNDSKILLLGTIWNGINLPGLAGWSQAAPALAPELRGPVAALFGKRYLMLGRRSEAKTFFQDALKVAEPGSTLRTIAEAGLRRVEQAKIESDSKSSESKPAGLK
jgi:tetratricopeptide (TPR) repeat protein